jgi:hypothetical protein
MSGFTDDAIVRHGVLDEGVSFIQSRSRRIHWPSRRGKFWTIPPVRQETDRASEFNEQFSNTRQSAANDERLVLNW